MLSHANLYIDAQVGIGSGRAKRST